MFLESFKGVAKSFRCGSLRGVLKALKGFFKKLSGLFLRVFEASSKGVCQRSYWSAWKFRCFKEFLKCLKKVSWVPREISRVFQECFKLNNKANEFVYLFVCELVNFYSFVLLGWWCFNVNLVIGFTKISLVLRPRAKPIKYKTMEEMPNNSHRLNIFETFSKIVADFQVVCQV